MIIYLEPSPLPDGSTLDVVRSKSTNRVIARVGSEGIYIWERLSRMQYVLSWAELLREYEKHACASEQK